MDQEKDTSVENTSVENTSVKEVELPEEEIVAKDMMNVSLVYLQNSVDELKKAGDLKEDLTDKEFSIYVHALETRIAYLLDITHRSFPLAFDLFPENHDNLKNCYILFKRFEKAGKLKECTSGYCKDNPVDPKDLEGVKTPEEVKEEMAAESDKSADDTSSSQEDSSKETEPSE